MPIFQSNHPQETSCLLLKSDPLLAFHLLVIFLHSLLNSKCLKKLQTFSEAFFSVYWDLAFRHILCLAWINFYKNSLKVCKFLQWQSQESFRRIYAQVLTRGDILQYYSLLIWNSSLTGHFITQDCYTSLQGLLQSAVGAPWNCALQTLTLKLTSSRTVASHLILNDSWREAKSNIKIDWVPITKYQVNW